MQTLLISFQRGSPPVEENLSEKGSVESARRLLPISFKPFSFSEVPWVPEPRNLDERKVRGFDFFLSFFPSLFFPFHCFGSGTQGSREVEYPCIMMSLFRHKLWCQWRTRVPQNLQPKTYGRNLRQKPNHSKGEGLTLIMISQSTKDDVISYNETIDKPSFIHVTLQLLCQFRGRDIHMILSMKFLLSKREVPDSWKSLLSEVSMA